MDDQLMTMQLAAIAHGLSAAVAGNAVPAQLGAAIEAALPFARALRLTIALDDDVVIESANLHSGSAMSWSLQRASDPSGQCIASNKCSLMVSENPSLASFRHPFASDSDGSTGSLLQGVGATIQGATFRVPIRGSSLSSDPAIGCLVIQIDPSDTSGVLRAVPTVAALVHALGFCLPLPAAALVANMRAILGLPRHPAAAPTQQPADPGLAAPESWLSPDSVDGHRPGIDGEGPPPTLQPRSKLKRKSSGGLLLHTASTLETISEDDSEILFGSGCSDDSAGTATLAQRSSMTRLRAFMSGSPPMCGTGAPASQPAAPAAPFAAGACQAAALGVGSPPARSTC